MKKVFILCSILSIFLSVSQLLSCDTGYTCCQEQHSSASQCATCTTHVESTYDTNVTVTNLVFNPKLVGQIFFGHIHKDSINIIYKPDRPPALIA